MDETDPRPGRKAYPHVVPWFPAAVYARLIEGEDGTHDLIWSRSKPKAA